MTVASTASGKFWSVNIGSMLEEPGKERFLKSDLSLAIADGRHRLPCIRKLSTSKQPGTKWALRTIRMTLITAPSSEVLSEHELLKLSSFTNVLFGFVLRGLSLTAILELPIQYSKIFELSYNASF